MPNRPIKGQKLQRFMLKTYRVARIHQNLKQITNREVKKADVESIRIITLRAGAARLNTWSVVLRGSSQVLIVIINYHSAVKLIIAELWRAVG